jgi:hypothetical protein
MINLAQERLRYVLEWFRVYFFPFFFQALVLTLWRRQQDVTDGFSNNGSKEDKLRVFYLAINDIAIQMVAFNPMIVHIVWTYIWNVAAKLLTSENEEDIGGSTRSTTPLQ